METIPAEKTNLRRQIFQKLGFVPDPSEMMGEFNSLGWCFKGIQYVRCQRAECDQRHQHMWHRPENNDRASRWVIVCNQCCRVSEISQFPMDEREKLTEAELGDETQPTFRVGFFCCGPCPEAVALIELLNRERFSQHKPPGKLRNNYSLVLEVFRGLRAANTRSSEDLRIELNELHAPFEMLRRTYRNQAYRKNMNINYSGITAEAYLLAYVPGHINQAQMALEKAFSHMAKEQRMALRSPELSLEFHLFDLRTKGWSDTRGGLLDYGCRKKWPHELKIREHQFDLHDIGSLAACRKTLNSLDLAMFQNFDNEIGNSSSGAKAQAAATITEIAAQMRQGSQLLLSDLEGSRETQKRLEKDWENRGIGEVAWEQKRGREVKPGNYRVWIHEQPSSGPLKDHFFTDFKGGRVARSWLKEINILVLNRPHQFRSRRQSIR